ncbi:MAG: tripartite tricarboxylate transporter TctB family protein, partial [Pannonibacter indicus]
MENPQPRRSFELVFSFFMFGASLFLFYTAYGISGFEALSAPGGVPMMTTGLMTVTSGMVLIQTLRKPAEGNQWALR